MKSGALGVGTLAGFAGASGMLAPEAGAAPAAAAEHAPTGPDSYFLKLDGVPGDSTDAAHKGEIQVLSFSWDAVNPASSSGRVNFSDFNFTAHTSKASPLLMLNTAAGKHLDSAVVTVSRKARGGSQEFIKIELSDVLVTAYQQGASTEATPVDSFSLNFTRIQYSYTSQSANGAPGATTTAEWDIRANKAP